MEALDFVKLHSLYAHFSSIIENTFPLFPSDFSEEDSFFDLEFISSPPLQPTCTFAGDIPPAAITSGEKLRFAPQDLISKRKILPYESLSSVPVLKSAPRISISLFKKPKLMAKQKGEERETSLLKLNTAESKRFTFKLTRINSFRKSSQTDESERQNKRFSREGVRKYLKLIRPLYVKVSKRSPEYSPASANRRDDSLLQQHDGIEGAILHCKRSFNASRDSELEQQKAGKEEQP